MDLPSATPPLRRLVRRSSGWLIVGALVAACATRFEPDRAARAPMLEGFGSIAMTVTTSSPAAQATFTRAMLQAYAFNEVEAARTFKAALAVDPRCAMCAWGVAYALGPNINAVERGDLTEAREYVALARRHAGSASARERGLIEALAARYGPADQAASGSEPPVAPICGSGSAAAPHPLDVVYADKMRVLSDSYPDDPDVTAFYAEATMIATRVDWWDRTTGAAAPGIAEMTARLERALERWPEHPGLNHYLIHAADSSPAPQRAQAAADRLGRLAPESPHLLHMPSHIYVRIGRFADAVDVNSAALAAEVRQTKKLEAQGFAPSVNWDGHNLHFLWFAALMDGRGDGALEQARLLAQRSVAGKSPSAELMRALPLLTLARLERWHEVLDEPEVRGDAGVAAAVTAYARGLALLRQGDRTGAEARAAALREARDAPVLAGKTVFADPGRNVLDVLSAQLDGEIAAAAGQPDKAREALDRGIRIEAALDSAEPPLLGEASRLALGDAMLNAGRWAAAEQAFRDDLAARPGNGWALRGLQRALAEKGDTAGAARVQAELMRTWASADARLIRR